MMIGYDGLVVNNAFINNITVRNYSQNGKRGVVPIGGIICLNNNTGSISVTSGVVSFDGWMLCDGAAIPSGLSISGNVPNLMNGRMLKGYTTCGVDGGVSEISSVNVSHNHTLSIATGAVSHYHSLDPYLASNPSHTHYSGNIKAALGAVWSDARYIGYTAIGSYYTSPDRAMYFPNVYSISGGFNHHTPVRGWTGYPNGASTVTPSINSTSSGHTHTVAGTINNNGNGSNIAIEPQFISQWFIMRVL